MISLTSTWVPSTNELNPHRTYSLELLTLPSGGNQLISLLWNLACVSEAVNAADTHINMFWRTFVVVKQIQSNPYQISAGYDGTSYILVKRGRFFKQRAVFLWVPCYANRYIHKNILVLVTQPVKFTCNKPYWMANITQLWNQHLQISHLKYICEQPIIR